jgi:hypothetical protein
VIPVFRSITEPVSVLFASDDGTLTPASAISRWSAGMVDATVKCGRVNPSEEQLKEKLETAGFAEVQTFTLNFPLGPWPKAKYGSIVRSVLPKSTLTAAPT